MRRVLATQYLLQTCRRAVRRSTVPLIRTPRQLWSCHLLFSNDASSNRPTPTTATSAPPSSPPSTTAQPPPLSPGVTSTPRSASPTAPSPPPPSSPPPPPPSSFTAPPSSPPPPPSSTPSSAFAPSPPSPSSSSVRGPISWKSFALLAVSSVVLVAYYQYERERRLTSFQPVVTIGRAAIGGPFSLISADGVPTSSSDLRGRYLMVYFGFTHCPDICPTELRKMEAALSFYHQHFPHHPITPVFISIDPHRDTPSRLRAYRQQYSPTFLFLTGSPEAIKEVAKSYRVYYSAPEGEGEDYLVDHSIFFYLLDRQGEVMDYYGKNFTAEEIATKLCSVINADNNSSAGQGKK